MMKRPRAIDLYCGAGGFSTGNVTEIHKQIGNAVPPALAEALFTAAFQHSIKC